MSDNFMIGSECADWWEQRNKAYHEELEQYVLDNPGNFAVFVATTKATSADFAMTMWVDLARIGEGFAEGGLSGITQDIFRILNFIPEGKVLQGSKGLLGRAVQAVSNLTVWRKLEGGLCLPIAIAQAMQRGGYRIGVGLSEIAAALGKPLRAIFKDGASVGAIKSALTQLGLQFTEFSGTAFRTFEALKQLAASQSGPLLVTIKAADGAVHSILVGKTLSGIKIIDRYGIFSNLDELARFYKRGPWSIHPSSIFAIANAMIDNSLINLVNNAGLMACLVRQSVAVFDINFSKVTKEELSADFDRFLARSGKKVLQGPAVNIVGGYSIEVAAGRPERSSLSGIAKAQYGEFELWPLIFDLNKDKIGPNPNRITPGTRLLLLPKERYTPVELADARRRCGTWRNHPH